MNKRLYASALALVLVLAPALGAAAQQPRTAPAGDGWSAVQALAPGEKLVVRTRDGERIAGRFVSASDLLLVVRHDETDMSFARDNVRLVQLNRGKSRLKGALFGAAVGGGAGFATGSVLYFPFRDDMMGATVPAFTALGAAVGLGLGAALAKGNKNVTVYEAR
ncbi:MAG TPA: hypothetical protein VN228_09990 [Pyrinomonadaceae bacterium]|nr:hypothetical protein [Pyrinomonadaceae bacterium]